MRSKRKTGRNFSSNRTKNTSDLQNKTPTKLAGSRSSSAISNKQSNYSSGIHSNNKESSRDSRNHALPLRQNHNGKNTEAEILNLKGAPFLACFARSGAFLSS